MGGVRPARMGGLEATEGVRVRAQCTVFACKGPPGPSSVATLPTRTGPSSSTWGQAGPIPTARPSPAQASPGSAVVEQSSGCLRSGPPAHPSGAPHAIPGATALEFGGTGETEALFACLGGLLPPAVRSLGGLVLQGTQPRPEPPSLRPSPAPGQGVRGGGPSPMCMHLCQEHVWAETQPTRPDGWGCSNVLSHSGIRRSGWAQRRKGLPLAATALPPASARP